MRNSDYKRLLGAFALALAPLTGHAGVLRVCADPNNLPFSNHMHQGFEDKIALLAARDLGDTLQYAYAPENERFIARTLHAGKCDVVMGIPADIPKLDTTRPYYASTYVFVSRESDGPGISSFTDPRLRKLRIGVHLIGGDSTPPALALGKEGIVDNVRGYMIEGDLAEANPPARLIEAVENRDVDVAAVWGPIAGYFAKQSGVPLAVTRVRDGTEFAPLRFAFPIAIGVRKGDPILLRKLDSFLVREQPAIREILGSYGVPFVTVQGGSHG